MAEAKTIAVPSLHLVDESFDPKKSNIYHLSILTEEKSLTYAVLDSETNKYVVLHSSIPIARGEEVLASLQGHGAASFRSVSCAIAHSKFTLVPASIYDEEKKESLLGFSHPEQGGYLFSNSLHNPEAKIVFSVPSVLANMIRGYFPNVKFIHSSSTFLQGLLAEHRSHAGKKVFADFHSTFLSITILEGRELLFCNAFDFQSPEEIAYYVLFVYEQLGLNTEETELVISGSIEKTAPEHALLYTYIRNMKFAKLPDSFKYSYKFEEIQGHRFFSLFNQYLVTK